MWNLGRHFGSFDRIMIPTLLFIATGVGVYHYTGSPWITLAVVGGIAFVDVILHLQYLMRRHYW